MQHPRTTHHRALGRVAILALALGLTVGTAACGGGSSDASSDPTVAVDETTTAAPDAGTDDGATATTEAAGADVDICAEITAEDVEAILTGADIADAKPNDAYPTPSCAYSVTWPGQPLSVVQILWNEDGFLDAQREGNPTATDVADLDDAIAISDSSIVVAGESGDFQVDGGIELAEGGDVATKDQLIAVAALAQAL